MRSTTDREMQAELRKSCSSEEGAALTEFALMTLFLIPLMLYAMFSGEAFISAIKAQEAEIAAGWDLTAYRYNAYEGGSTRSQYTLATGSTANRVTTEMRDLDSYRQSGGAGMTQVTTRTTLASVRCALRTGSMGGLAPYNAGLPQQFLHSDGYVGCQAQVRLENVFLPRRLHQEFIRSELITSRIARMTMCGLGATVQGCTGSRAAGFMLLTDDWALSNGAANPVGTQLNRGYYNVTNSVYGLGGGSTAGTAAVTAAMAFLLLSADQGTTSTLKLGYLSPVFSRRLVPTDMGFHDPHLSPWDEEAHLDTSFTPGISSRVYTERSNGRYMGKLNPLYNEP